MHRRALVLALAALVISGAANAQSCPEPLASARRLVFVTADNMTTSSARLTYYERGGDQQWREIKASEPALIGRNGMGWAQGFRTLARPTEPIKTEGDKRVPAGVFRIGRSFGFAASSRPGHLQLQADTVCVDDPASSAYNTVTSRAKVGQVHAENMRRVPAYRHGLMVDYPTDRVARAGSCIFIHLWLPQAKGTAGCVALPEQRLAALQDFAEEGATLVVLPRAALDRLPGCLPQARREAN